MKIFKPKFWDINKSSIFSKFLKIFTLPIIIKNKFPSKKIKFFKIITICVGNIYIGGTGKTPSSILIYNLLKKNKKVIFIKKFYKNQNDERKLLTKYGNLISKKLRKDSIISAIKKKYNVAIIDDGLQDKSVEYDIKIVCFNSKIGIGNGQLMPAGPLREKLENLKNYQIAFINGNDNPNKALIKTIKKFNKKIKIFNCTYVPTKNQFINKNKNYIAFSGIGNHEIFLDTLKKYSIKVIKDLKFPDHYTFKDKDIENIKRQAQILKSNIITTEKDYLRLNLKNKKNIYCLKIELRIKKKHDLLKYLNSYEKN